MIRKFSDNLNELYLFRQVLWQLIKQQLILRYRRTFLGYFWTLFNPLLMMTVTAIVFSTIFKTDLKTYSVFLFAGMIPFNLFSASLNKSSPVFINNEALLKKIYIPKVLFPLSISVSVAIDSVLSFVVLMFLILLIGGKVSLSLISIPIAFFLLSVFTLGISLILSVITTFMRDIEHLVVIFLQALFFLSPILYDKTNISGKLEVFISLNPLVPYIELFRAPIYLASWPSMSVVLSATVLAVVSLLCGMVFFYYQQNKIIYRL